LPDIYYSIGVTGFSPTSLDVSMVPLQISSSFIPETVSMPLTSHPPYAPDLARGQLHDAWFGKYNAKIG